MGFSVAYLLTHEFYKLQLCTFLLMTNIEYRIKLGRLSNYENTMSFCCMIIILLNTMLYSYISNVFIKHTSCVKIIQFEITVNIILYTFFEVFL